MSLEEFELILILLLSRYVKWMMYWIVFALFTALETFTDFFFAWYLVVSLNSQTILDGQVVPSLL